MSSTELKQGRIALIDESKKVLDKCDAEKRGPSRRETARLDENDKKIDLLSEQIDEAERQEQRDRRAAALAYEQKTGRKVGEGKPDPRAMLSDYTTSSRPEGQVFAPEQRVADYVRHHRGDDYASENPEDYSLGRVVRARITGDHRGLTDVERRAMSEGTDSEGGFLVPEILSGDIIDLARPPSDSRGAST